jgi:hypothetical protein
MVSYINIYTYSYTFAQDVLYRLLEKGLIITVAKPRQGSSARETISLDQNLQLINESLSLMLKISWSDLSLL